MECARPRFSQRIITLMQTALDFTHTENNRESEMHYISRLDHFSAQCSKVLSILRRGDRLSVYDAMVVHGISSLPRRIKDLRDAGIAIQDEWVVVDGEQRHKQYYL